MNKQPKQLQCEDNIMINNISFFSIAHPLSQPIEDLPIEPLKKKKRYLKHVVNRNSNFVIKVQSRKPRQAN